jgi:exopolyphosphatase / guanosine-5'-triphosphate,3'-diphosphate pyrophosphatase
VVRANAELVAATVHKRRQRFALGGSAGELTDVRANGRTTRTIAVESEDPARLLAVVRELGLDSLPNLSYPLGLAALLGLHARRFAVIDVGTNSVKLHVAELERDGSWRTIADRAEVTRLGEGLAHTGRFAAEPMERTLAAIAAMAEEAHSEGAEAIAAVGTAGLRVASNSAELVAAARARSSVVIEIVSGEEEGRLAYLGATSGLGSAPGSLVVFDTGGGSSQFTFGHRDVVAERFSLDVGAVGFTERFTLAEASSDETVRAALGAIAAALAPLDGREAPDMLVAMGGTVTNLAAVKHGLESYDPDVVQGTELDLPEIDRQLELYRARSADERRAIAGLQPRRAEIILAGACIVRTVMTKLGKESVVVSDRALRHGLIAERFGPAGR